MARTSRTSKTLVYCIRSSRSDEMEGGSGKGPGSLAKRHDKTGANREGEKVALIVDYSTIEIK